MKNYIKKNRYFILLAFIFILYFTFLIHRSSFEIGNERYFVLFDDEMISMRYAKNLASGHGLVWNPGGEKIEGFTNPFWTLYMAFFHIFPILPAKISLPIQISNMFFLLINLYFVKKIVDLIIKKSTFVTTFSIILTAFYFPLINWGLLGTETSILTLLTSISVFLTLKCMKQKKFSYLLFITLGVTTLIRMDMIILSLIITAFLISTDKKNRKNILIGFCIIACFVVLQTVLRFLYYHELLPNTYYLKATGYPFLMRIARGIYVTGQFIFGMNWILFLIFLSGLFINRQKSFIFIYLAFFGQILYSIYVGGDAWEYFGGSNRYISLTMPLFFILFSFNLLKIWKLIFSIPCRYSNLLFGLLLILVYITFNSVSQDSLQQWIGIKKLSTVGGNKLNVERAILLNKITSPKARIAVDWAGTVPYFLGDRYFIDLLGKSDKVVARIKMHDPKSFMNFISFLPGHNKYNAEYSIKQQKPDIVAQLIPLRETQKYFDKNYQILPLPNGMEAFYLLNTSKHVNFKMVENIKKLKKF